MGPVISGWATSVSFLPQQRLLTWKVCPTDCAGVSSVAPMIATRYVYCHSADEATEAKGSSITCHLGSKSRSHTLNSPESKLLVPM